MERCRLIKLSLDLTLPQYTEEELEKYEASVMRRAELGAITYSAAVSKGEQRIMRHVREAGWPIVILLLDGFPPEGSESERYYKPGGVYFDTCLKGKLLMLEATAEAYADPRVIERTEAELKRKAEEKHRWYEPIHHTTKRWRMIAGNVMLRMIADEE